MFNSPASAGTPLAIGLVVLAPPASSAQAGVPYTFIVQTNAPSSDTVTITPVSLPAGMQFDGVNTFTWTPSSAQVNTAPEFYATLSDSLGNTASIGPLNISVILGLAPIQIPVNTSLGGSVSVLFYGSQVLAYDNITHAVLSFNTFKSSDAVEIDAPAGQANQVVVLLPNSSSAAMPKEVLVQGAAGATNNLVNVLGIGGANTFTVAGGAVFANGLETQLANVQALMLTGFGSSNYFNLNSSAMPTYVVDTGSSNTMDFSQDTAGVAVNLGLGKGQAQWIAPWHTTMAIYGTINKLIGSQYADVLTGGSGQSIVMGGGGNDTLVGGTGQNVIIAGTGTCNIYTNGSENMVFCGTTNWDSNNDQALLNLLSEGPLFMYGYSYRRAVASAAKDPSPSSLIKLTYANAHDAVYGSLNNSVVLR